MGSISMKLLKHLFRNLQIFSDLRNKLTVEKRKFPVNFPMRSSSIIGKVIASLFLGIKVSVVAVMLLQLLHYMSIISAELPVNGLPFQSNTLLIVGMLRVFMVVSVVGFQEYPDLCKVMA